MIPTAVLGYTGLRIGDATCTESGDSIPDLSCLGNVFGGLALGALAGLVTGVLLAVRVARYLKRRWRSVLPAETT